MGRGPIRREEGKGGGGGVEQREGFDEMSEYKKPSIACVFQEKEL